MLEEAQEIIRKLLSIAPNTMDRDKDPSWEWCWNELSDGAQETVQEITAEAREFLEKLSTAKIGIIQCL